MKKITRFIVPLLCVSVLSSCSGSSKKSSSSQPLPEVKVASCIIKGSYDQMGEAYATVASWIKANGYKMNGPMFNIYHVSPAQTQNPDEYVTEACFPIE